VVIKLTVPSCLAPSNETTVRDPIILRRTPTSSVLWASNI
jgi:hypothetical protein